MRAIYRLSPADALALSASEYFALAYRLPYYPGACQAIALAARAESEPAQPTSSSNGNGQGVRRVPATRTAIMGDPVLSRVISFGGA